jgi:AcrR family transcriptional regulator
MVPLRVKPPTPDGPAIARAARVRPYHRGNTGPDALAAARRLLHEQGVRAVTTVAVARTIGTSRAAVARIYPTRGALIGRLAADAVGSLGTTLGTAAAAARELPPTERGAAIGRAYLGWARANPHEYALLFTTRPPGSERSPRRGLHEEHGGTVPPAFGAGMPPWTGDPARNPAFATWALLHGIATLLTSGPLADLDDASAARVADGVLDRLADLVR